MISMLQLRSKFVMQFQVKEYDMLTNNLGILAGRGQALKDLFLQELTANK